MCEQYINKLKFKIYSTFLTMRLQGMLTQSQKAVTKTKIKFMFTKI